MNDLKQSTNKKNKALLMIAGITLLTGATLITTTGCSNDYRGATIYRPAYFSPYDYYYYPYWSVYFNISTGYYYYRDGVTWIKVRTLPSRFILDDRDRVRVVINSDKPYLKHAEHRIQYTPRPNIKYERTRDIRERTSNQSRFKNNRRR